MSPKGAAVMDTKMPDTRRVAAYAAVYIDRGEKLTSGRGSVPEQLAAIRKMAAAREQKIGVVGIDVIVGKRQAGKIEALVEEAERLAHEAFADEPYELTFCVSGLLAETTGKDPRDSPRSARSILATGKTDLPESAEVIETDHGYAVRHLEP
jgi:hypothetical protein